MKIAVLPGDGIGPEIIAEAVRVLQVLDERFELEFADVGGAAFEAHGHPLPEATLKLALQADAVLFGAVGDWKYDKLERALRPEQAILGLRKSLGLFANLRPAILYPELAAASTLKPEVVAGLDILIVRELTGDIYFGQPRGRRTSPDGPFAGAPEAFDTMRYSRPEIERIAHVAFQAARHPGIRARRHYVDATALDLVRRPWTFDVLVTENMFGDILSDEAAGLVGGMGMAPSADIGDAHGLFQPCHGSAPDIAGQGKANPTAMILSAAMMLDWLGERHDDPRLVEAARRIESAVNAAFASGRLLPIELGGRDGTAAIASAVAGNL